ncbi:MAG: methylmalonyl Co-A mutase-associated GTPase MeaB [Saprospiraceae bacterium]
MKSANKIDKKYIVELYSKLINKDRIALSQAITLVESTIVKHQTFAEDLLDMCLPFSGNAIRIGITGTPGVGKSTFIESLGQKYIDKGQRVAVLTIDPTSPINQGSILGDKSRMTILSQSKSAYIRSSPSKTVLGGTTDRTRETMILCESAGYDVIIIETVGVGQSETEISHMVDLILLLVLPGGGDEIQGIKRGIVEIADMVIVNKKDNFKNTIVQETVNTFKFAMHVRPNIKRIKICAVMTCSALFHEGMDEILEELEGYFYSIIESGYLDSNRASQTQVWLESRIHQEALIQIKAVINNHEYGKIVKQKVLSKEWSIAYGVRKIVDKIMNLNKSS